MAAISIGPKGFIEISTSMSGVVRKIRLVSFMGRATTGLCESAGFRASDQVAGVINLTKGRICTSSFTATLLTGGITLADTGGLGSDGSFAATQELLALCLGDTGTPG